MLLKQFIAIATPPGDALLCLLLWEKLLQNHGEEKFSQDIAFQLCPGWAQRSFRNMQGHLIWQHRGLSKVCLWMHNLLCRNGGMLIDTLQPRPATVLQGGFDEGEPVYIGKQELLAQNVRCTRIDLKLVPQECCIALQQRSHIG